MGRYHFCFTDPIAGVSQLTAGCQADGNWRFEPRAMLIRSLDPKEGRSIVKDESIERRSRRGTWVAVGLALGAGIGAAINNLAVGIGVGLAIGAAMGAATDRRKDDKAPEGE